MGYVLGVVVGSAVLVAVCAAVLLAPVWEYQDPFCAGGRVEKKDGGFATRPGECSVLFGVVFRSFKSRPFGGAGSLGY